MIDPAFWRNRRVFVTGHTGFMGGWLILLLERLGAQVHGYALDPAAGPTLFAAAGVKAALASDTRGDIVDLPSLTAAVGRAAPDILFHLAAQPLVLESYRSPLATYAVNVLGTAHVLEALRGVAGAMAAVVVTSDKAYRNDGGGRAFREDDPLGGADPYSSSKACADLVTAAYRASFFAEAGCRIASVRAGNVIGGGDWGKERLIPDCARAFAAGEPVVLRHPAAVRPWQHVLDAVYGYLLLAEKMASPGGADFAAAWNFGPGQESAATAQDVATAFMTALGGAVRTQVRADAPHEAPVLLLESARARGGLGWSPKLPLEKTLETTAAWYAAWTKNTDMAAFTRGQIAAYISA